jgi:hypothetical protein
MKKGPLGKTEVFYIKHNYKSTSVEELAKELDRAQSLIMSCIEKCKKQEIDSEPLNVANQMFTNKKGSIVMTQNASAMSDDIKKVKAKNPRHRKQCITKIK